MQFQDETLESSVKAINDVLQARLQQCQRDQKRNVDGYDYVEDVQPR